MAGTVNKVDQVWQDFFKTRTEDLAKRFPGWHRAEVVETNDPLRMHRVRFKMPEMHDNNLKPEECPWAVPDPCMGGKRAGFWPTICKGDQVWINFEKGHPYGPIWSGAADPTRRKFYVLESIYGQTQTAVNDKGEPAAAPDDYDKDYLPKDERPMSTGFKDRYGNLSMMSAVGFFPKEHKEKPAPVGTDPVTQGSFKASQNPPEENKPDMKFMVQMSKYGNYMLIADMGYKWKNEFDGDFDKDEEFEIKRVKYIQKLFSENEKDGVDQRRIELRTRFGHKFEMRDVGWKKARPDEFDKQISLSEVEGKNEKEQVWFRMITKDGSYFRMWSKGADLEKNNYIKRLNKSDVGTKPYDEDKFGDGQKDCRGFYFCSPRQQIFAIDDAGADPKDPQNKEKPYPNGIYMGGWRDGHHFGLEYNLKDELQRWAMYTSTGIGLELNQKWDYACLTTKPPKTIAREFDKPYNKVPWSLKTFKGMNVEKYCFHLMLDFWNKYIRLKTPKGQGVEMRDGDSKDSCGGTWTEIRDADDRGIWFSKENNFGIWRDKKKKKYICINDNTDYIIVRNELKSVQIYAQKDVEIIANGSIKMKAGGSVDIVAGGAVNIKGSEVKAGPILRTMDFYTATRCGGHPAVYIPRHIAGTASCGGSPSASSPSQMVCTEMKPQDFDKERGCDPQKKKKGPVDKMVVQCGPGQGGGGGGGGGGGSNMDPKTGSNPDVFDPTTGTPDIVNDPSAGPPPPAPPVVDPIDKCTLTGVLWFGTSSNFDDNISVDGIQRLSMTNPLFDPENPPGYIPLSVSTDAAGKYADISIQKYGGNRSIYRIVAVDNGDLLVKDQQDAELVRYSGDNIRTSYTEKFE